MIFELLQAFTETSAPSGSEEPVRRLFLEEAAALADEVYQDRIGSAVAVKHGSGAEPRRRILLAAHMDEIGFVVTQREEGFLRFDPIGGFDPRVLIGQEVILHTRSGPLPAIVASRPPHVQTAQDRARVPRSRDLFLDPGLSPAQLKRRVQIGDVATLRRDLTRLNEHVVSGKALDDRAAVVTLLAALGELQRLRHEWDVYAVASIQEEAGAPYLGAATSTFAIRPNVGLAVDVTHGEMHGVSEAKTVPFGQGPALVTGPNVHPRLYARLKQVAEAQEIPYVTEPEAGSSHTDAWAIQIVAEGVPTALIGLPLRYMHSSVETADLRDLERAARLLAHFIAGLDEAAHQELQAW